MYRISSFVPTTPEGITVVDCGLEYVDAAVTARRFQAEAAGGAEHRHAMGLVRSARRALEAAFDNLSLEEREILHP